MAGPAGVPIERFRDIDVFRGLTDQEIGALVRTATRQEYRAGQTICREGSAAECFYLIERGQAEVLKAIKGREVSVARLEGGVAFGEMGVVLAKPRNATIRAITDMTCWRVPRDGFEQACGGGGAGMVKCALNMVRSLATRLDRIDVAFAELLNEQSVAPAIAENEELRRFRDRLHAERAF